MGVYYSLLWFIALYQNFRSGASRLNKLVKCGKSYFSAIRIGEVFIYFLPCQCVPQENRMERIHYYRGPQRWCRYVFGVTKDLAVP